MFPMKKAFFVLLVLSLEAFAADDAALARVRKSLEEAPVLRANFEQTKTMRALERPLVLSGRLVFSKSHGVLWSIDAPIRRRYILGETRVAEIDEDGTRTERGIDDLPGFSQAARIFGALLRGDAQTLEGVFDLSVDGSGEAGGWAITLVPKAEPLAQFLTEARIAGSRFVERLTIVEALGDRSEIRFVDTRGDASLAGDERALFEGLSSGKP
jgi:hypothetical protein